MSERVAILVPGFGSLGAEWLGSPIRSKLIETGWQTKIFRNFDRGRCDLNWNVNKLLDKIDEYYDKQLILIGHSMGGLICRHAAQAQNSRHYNPRVSALITVCSPHKGTYKALLSPHRASRQMLPGSDYLKQLNWRRPSCPSLSISASMDLLIPKKNSKLPGALQHIELSFGHCGPLFSRAAANVISDFLRERL